MAKNTGHGSRVGVLPAGRYGSTMWTRRIVTNARPVTDHKRRWWWPW